jgi:hypothetical protein
MQGQRRSRKPSRLGAIVLLAALFALRAIWVPAHLIREHHRHPHPGLASWPCGPLEAAHDPVEHGQGHEHEHEHEPHPSADHCAEIVWPRSVRTVELICVPLETPNALPPARWSGHAAEQVAWHVPEPLPPRTGLARAPPGRERAARA